MGQVARALITLALILVGCEKDKKDDAKPGTSEPALPRPRIDVVSATELPPTNDWQVNAWDVTTPNSKGYLTFRLVDRDGSIQKWSSKMLVRTSVKIRATLRYRVVGREIEIQWSMKGKRQEAKGDGKVAIPEGGPVGPSLSAGGVPVAEEGEPLVINQWHALMLHAWSPGGAKPSANVPLGEEWFTFRLDGREVDLATYGLPVLQAHIRFTEE